MRTTISIALATYNGERYLSELLDSIAAQTLQPYELIVSDDHSTDNTRAIIETFASKVAFKVSFASNTKTKGILGNFASAFERCTGDLIAYCDQDDIWYPQKLEKAATFFDDPKIKLVIHRSEAVNQNLEPLGYDIPPIGSVEFGRTAFPSSYEMTYGLGHQMLFDACLYRDYHPMFQHNIQALHAIAENYDTQFSFLAGLCGDIIMLEDTLVKFRRHQHATSDAGITSSNDATTQGFLGKTSNEYQLKAEELRSIIQAIRTDIIETLPAYKQSLLTYCDFLEHRAKLFNKRSHIYINQQCISRLTSLVNLLTHCAYRRKSKAGFGRKALIVDTAVAIFGLNGLKKLIRLKAKIR